MARETTTEAVAKEFRTSVREANKAESVVARQIIIIDSGLVAAVAVVALSASKDDIQNLSLLPRVLLIIIALSLTTSLVGGVVHLLLDRSFWSTTSAMKRLQLKLIREAGNEQSKYDIAVAIDKVMKTSSNRAALWVEVCFFLFSMVFIVILAVSRLLVG